MCGIAGWIDLKNSLEEYENVMSEMSASLNHRGPDAGGSFRGTGCLLAHRRLSVIDPENGAQPMTYSRFTIVYNGELYNTAELRSKLKNLGHTFDTASDTEVLLKSYAEWGRNCLERLNGIYAFAVWDKAGRKLFLARDRAGVKPLFYHRYENGIVFASEIKALFRCPKVKPVLDEEGAASLMLLGPARKGGLGVFKGIEELLPGEFAEFDANGFGKHRYWQLKAVPHTESLAETADHLGFLIKDSVERQLVSDVPLCTFLSGGLDSSLISAIAARKFASEGRRLNTYSIDYKDNRKNFVASAFQPDEDAPWIDEMSAFIGSQHTNVIIDSPALAEALDPSMEARDLPGMADVDSSLYLFCREVKKNFTVAVSGECADEIFGGYPWYHKPELLFADGFPWARSTEKRAGLLRPELAAKIHPAEYVRNAADATAAGMSVLDTDSGEEKARRRMFLLNFYWFMQTLLDRKDRCSMAHGLEVRVPFCDHRIAEYAYNIPWEMKSLGGREKGLVRKISERYLPHDVAWRKKSPYPKTHNPSYAKLVFDRFVKLMQEPGCRLPLIIDKRKITELIATEGSSFSENWYGQLMTTPQMFAYLIQLELWFRKYDPEIQF
ncbi:MAG TPA: asparagine synthase (glutamine-hydrolyzing) [Ruminococcaceae bacterium]|nr:asparagine synthase (glutamine-hydrolyzing) [Oscillospiraceae bacterium]